jgi:Cu(I)/Ag(I) efflux system membrane fusion protein
MAQSDGVVTDKPVQEGMRVDAGEALYRTADLSDMWLIAQVQEQDLGAIRPGEQAHASFFPGRAFDGKVDFIYPALSADTRTARVRIVKRAQTLVGGHTNRPSHLRRDQVLLLGATRLGE